MARYVRVVKKTNRNTTLTLSNPIVGRGGILKRVEREGVLFLFADVVLQALMLELLVRLDKEKR